MEALQPVPTPVPVSSYFPIEGGSPCTSTRFPTLHEYPASRTLTHVYLCTRIGEHFV
jgi:hypothetical protein